MAINGTKSDIVLSKSHVTTQFQDLEETLNTNLFRSLTQPGVFAHLAWAGWKGNYYTLSTLQLYSRKIILVDDHALHLLWDPSNSQQYIKPLPSIFADDIDPKKLGPLAQGLLYSYIRLVQSELDFRVAHELKLFPPSITSDHIGWKKWIALGEGIWGTSSHYRITANREHHPRCTSGVEVICNFGPCAGFRSRKQAENDLYELQHQALLQKCHQRYQYGHLRLDRIDWICRLNWNVKGTHFFNTHSKTSTFLFKHSHLLTVYVFYVAVVLTAMQVALQAFPSTHWSTEIFGYFGFVVVFFTLGQVPFVISYICAWYLYRITYFFIKDHRLSAAIDKWRIRNRNDTDCGNEEV